jgi:hypothetical protein
MRPFLFEKKTTHRFSVLSVKLEIINISRKFVAGFWKFAIEKSYEGNVTKKMLRFSTAGARWREPQS